MEVHEKVIALVALFVVAGVVLALAEIILSWGKRG